MARPTIPKRMKKTQITITIKPQRLEILKKWAEKEDVSVNRLINELLKKYVD